MMGRSRTLPDMFATRVNNLKRVTVTKSDQATDFVDFFPVWRYPEVLDSFLCSIFAIDDNYPSEVGASFRAIHLFEWKLRFIVRSRITTRKCNKYVWWSIGPWVIIEMLIGTAGLHHTLAPLKPWMGAFISSFMKVLTPIEQLARSSSIRISHSGSWPYTCLFTFSIISLISLQEPSVAFAE